MDGKESAREYTVSVIIPVYNAQKHLRKCVDSVVTPEVEVILVDDGSTDDSPRICDDYAREYPNCKVIHQRNGGVSRARNAGICLAHGAWLCFVDADDYVDTELFKEVCAEVHRFRQTDVVLFAEHLQDRLWEQEFCMKALLGSQEEQQKLGSSVCCVFSKLYRKEFLSCKEIRFPEDVINGEDLLFNFHAFACAESIRSCHRSFYRFRKNMQSSTNRFNPAILETERLFHDILNRYYTERRLTDGNWQYLYNKTLLTGVYGVLYRFSLAQDKTEWNKIDSWLQTEEYRNVFSEFDTYAPDLSAPQRYVLSPMKNGNLEKAKRRSLLVCAVKQLLFRSNETIINI